MKLNILDSARSKTPRVGMVFPTSLTIIVIFQQNLLKLLVKSYEIPSSSF